MSSNPHSSAPSPRASRKSPLRTRRNRTALAGAALLVALPVLAACSAGTNPEVYDIKPDNGLATAGDMWISNVWVVSDANTGNAEVIGQVANTNPSQSETTQLTSVTVNGQPASVQETGTSTLSPGVTVTGSDVSIPGLRSVQFGQQGQPQLLATDPGVVIGQNAQVVYTFSDGTTATVTAQVQPNSGLWAQYNPNGPSTATALPTTTASGTATPTATASTTATGTSTATASTTAKATSSSTGNTVFSGTPNPSSSS
ncbi:hypothetical protein KDL01_09820 [Actinospica durhamensis]|uniref:Lipoprotein n=1 Tax=Actinospica durhamensis TaxID=1508375 RepID=A0A941IR43_9ACTN|nr:hypothetical protein [Actinospica durhamensis]MBR7833563.1 hypothetical protein [Actinospica durhamensis]